MPYDVYIDGKGMSHEPKPKYLKDYLEPEFEIETLHLSFDLDDPITTVTSTAVFKRQANKAVPLVLQGEGLTLISVKIDGETWEDLHEENNLLTLDNVPEHFTCEIITEIEPANNTALSGLYKSTNNYCTQCEAEGFRRITYFLDRPDVLTTYTTEICADKQKYPILLSNGNKIDSGELPQGRHFVTWHDPHKKPCYLFALVAGDLACRKDSFTTRSGRKVALEIFVPESDLDRTEHAMASLKESMRWDEEKYDREYDLDVYMIVAVPDFNMGAMENKGLNIFNTKYVLADRATATDMDYQLIQAVIGHEYFHNWTGNRITCRDWFQLSLKEGLTVFRDQEFTSDMHSRPVKRIHDVRAIRSAQFAEDASPMAHSVRPDSYIEMNNFYTLTVYNKGAEVIRMMHTLANPEGFKRGMDLYFERFDGMAVTCDDFRQAISDGAGIDLTQFERWYDQAGTPVVEASGTFDAQAHTYTLTLKQSCPATPGQPDKAPFQIPVKVGLIDSTGKDMTTTCEGKTESEHVLNFIEPEQTFVFEGVKEKPTPSLLRDFSAPVKFNYPYTEAELTFLFAHDSNAFNRWDAGQQLASHHILNLITELLEDNELQTDSEFIEALRKTLNDPKLDPALIAEAIQFPSEETIGEQMETVLVDEIHLARQLVLKEISVKLRDDLLKAYHQHKEAQGADATSIARRTLKNVVLNLLMAEPNEQITELCKAQFEHASNMTDQLAAFMALCNHPDQDVRQSAIETFFDAWSDDLLVVCKWLGTQAASIYADRSSLDELMASSAFDLQNPNKVYALLITLGKNQKVLHDRSGENYELIANTVKKLDKINPQVASRVVRLLMNWRRFDQDRQMLMKGALESIVSDGLSQDVYEIVSKSLDTELTSE